MNTKKITFIYLPILSFVVLFILFFTPLQTRADGMSCTNDNSDAELRLPFDGVWRITQGYNCIGQNCSHKLYPSGFDLRNALDFGELNYQTANQPIYAPGDGVIAPGGGGSAPFTEIICINLDGLGSMEMGHFETRGLEQYSIPSVGTRVSRGEIVGQLLSSGSDISTAPHLHIAYYNNNNCEHKTVPFDNLFGIPLFDNGDYNLYGPQYNGLSTQYQQVGCGETPDPAEYLPGSNVLTAAYYNSYVFEPYDVYISKHDIDLDVTTTIVSKNPVVDESLIAVLIRIVKEGLQYGPWLLALMIIITGFMFITSMGITTRIMRARSAFRYVIIGTIVVLFLSALMELMEGTFVSSLGTILKYFV